MKIQEKVQTDLLGIFFRHHIPMDRDLVSGIMKIEVWLKLMVMTTMVVAVVVMMAAIVNHNRLYIFF